MKVCPGRKQNLRGVNSQLVPKDHEGEALMSKDRPKNVTVLIHETPSLIEEIARLRRAIVTDARFILNHNV